MRDRAPAHIAMMCVGAHHRSGARTFRWTGFLRGPAATDKPIARCDPASFPIRYSLFAIRYPPLCFGATMSLTVAVQMDPIE
ncbi:MAG: hypothetical protein ACJ8BE_24095, partial [Microvirga sp.]